VKTAKWAELATFFRADGWREVRRTGDIHYEKVLDSGDVLHSMRSSGKNDETIGKDKFAEILRLQLRVSAQEFWDCVNSGEPVRRPGRPAPVPPNALPLWLVRGLFAELGLRETDIRGMTEEDARRLLNEARSRPRDLHDE
jgi:hypothetical protein